MGGIIVVDFIDMQSSEHKQKLNEKMKKCMESDRAKHSILPLSKFGLMQITRQRVRPEMNISTIEKCPTCNGTGQVSPSILLVDKIENQIESVIGNITDWRFTLKMHPYVAAYVTRGLFPVKLQWSFKFKKLIRIIPVSSYDFLECHLFDSKGNELSI